jgi:hypothetical protein
LVGQEEGERWRRLHGLAAGPHKEKLGRPGRLRRLKKDGGDWATRRVSVQEARKKRNSLSHFLILFSNEFYSN